MLGLCSASFSSVWYIIFDKPVWKGVVLDMFSGRRQIYRCPSEGEQHGPTCKKAKKASKACSLRDSFRMDIRSLKCSLLWDLLLQGQIFSADISKVMWNIRQPEIQVFVFCLLALPLPYLGFRWVIFAWGFFGVYFWTVLKCMLLPSLFLIWTVVDITWETSLESL